MEGAIGFNDAAVKFSDDETIKFAGPFVTGRDGSTYVTIDQLDKDMVGMIGTMKVATFPNPHSLKVSKGKRACG